MRPLARETAVTSPSSAFPSALRAGALAALGTWTVVVLPALVGWVAAPESSVGWFSAVSVASAIWFVGHGQSVGAGGVAISMTPLLLLAVFVYIAFRFARRLAETERLRVGGDDWSRVAKWGVVPGFLVGYGLAAAVVALFTLGGPATPGAAAVLGSLLVPVAALGFVMVRPDDDSAPAFVRTWFRRGPTWLPSVWRIGWRGARLLLGVGLALVLVKVVLAWPEVADIQDQYSANLGALGVIVLAQVALLGNAATWALSFLAGPGFQIALGSTVSPAAAQPGLLPLVPLFGALPGAADFPTAMYAVLLVPVAVGAWLGSRVDSALEFFGNVRSRLTATVTAAVLAVLVVIGLTALGNGAVGVDRLAAVGPHLLTFAAALLAEVFGGALLWVAALLVRERLASRRGRDGNSLASSTGAADDADADAQTSTSI
ncbi:cell division protein PerM [Terrabacter sp. 2RAF25]|uniref:cell division protein PerM n=1 Tax=Terrabacter sp. 2RAF25 TaxID=3232998 RepID=UPI003F9D8E68